MAGKPWTFIACLGIVLVWATTGPIFKFNETWQLVINTGTTIITFLMVLQAVRVSAEKLPLYFNRLQDSSIQDAAMSPQRSE